MHKSVVETAEEFIANLRESIIQHRLTWHAPTVAYNELDDLIEASWWQLNKALIITIKFDAPLSFLKVWGPNIHSQMEEGENPTNSDLIELWQWLYAQTM